MADYSIQSDDLDTPEDYHLLAKQHAEADALTQWGRKKIVPASHFPKPKEVYRDFVPKVQRVSEPKDSEEGWQRIIKSIERMEKDYTAKNS